MPRLKADPAVRTWWLVVNSMQGVVRAQQDSLTGDREWGAFLRLLEGVTPKVAATLRGTRPSRSPGITSVSTPQTEAPAVDAVYLLDDDSSVPRHMTVTRELGSVLARASAINEKRSSFDLSFSSLLLGVLYGDDPLGHWLADYFEKQGVNVAHALSKVRKHAEAAEAAPSPGCTSAGRHSSSPDATLGRPARPLKRRPGSPRSRRNVEHVDAPHLVAAVIALTDYHEEDFGALALDRPRWGAAFVQHMAREGVTPPPSSSGDGSTPGGSPATSSPRWSPSSVPAIAPTTTLMPTRRMTCWRSTTRSPPSPT